MVGGDYGGIDIRLTMDGPEIIKADDVIGVSATILTIAGHHFTTNDAGELVILGELTYRPIRFDQDGKVIVCQRIT